MARFLGLILFSIFIAGCSEDSEPLSPVLQTAPIHSQVADQMPPGRLAALQVETALSVDGDMATRTSTAVALWSFWADRIDACLSASGLEQSTSRFVSPATDDPIWDLQREPLGFFRPYGREWNEIHGFASEFPDQFWTREEVGFLSLSSLDLFDSDCARSTYPFDSVLAPGPNSEYGSFLDSLALEVHNAIRTDAEQELWIAWDAQLEPLADDLPPEDWLDECLLDGGVAPSLVDSDHWEVLSGPDTAEQGAQYSVVEAECLNNVFTPLDNELLDLATSFANEHEHEISQSLALDSRVEEWIVQKSN